MATRENAVIPGNVVQGRRLPLHATLAGRLKKARQAAGLERKALSVAAGMAHPTVWTLETEGRTPKIDTVEKLARILNVSPCYLAYGVEGEPPPPLVEGALRAAGCGARVARLREHRGLSSLALGKASATSDTTVRLTERGETLPSVATVEALAVALDCSPCWLAFGEGTDPLQEPARAAAEAAAVKYRPPRKPVAPRRRRAPRKAPAPPREPR